MTVGLHPYLAYRPSGAEWLGDVPSHWDVLSGRACYSSEQTLNKGMIEITVLTLSYGQIKIRPKEKLHGLVPESFETYQLVEPGDIVCRPTDLQNDWNSLRFGLSPYNGIITSAYMCLRTGVKLSGRYGHLLLHTYDLKKVFYGLGSGLRQNLSWTDFKLLPCLVPPLPEQRAIVRYLDHVDRRIRRYISAKRKLIALLEEERAAVVNQVVTRGLDPNVRLKPSGVEWLGDVPENWEVRRLSQVSRILRGKFTHRPRNDPSLYDGPYPFIQTGDISGASKMILGYKQTLNGQGLAVSTMFPRGTLVMTIAANIGDVAILNFDACFPDSVVGFVPSENVHRDHMYYLFRAMKNELLREAPVNTQGNLNIERIGSRRVALASLPEQAAIVEYLDKATANIDAAIARARRQIDLVQEYRTRLIADVVTGKLDVREAAAQLPDETDDQDPIEESGPLADGMDEALYDIDESAEELAIESEVSA